MRTFNKTSYQQICSHEHIAYFSLYIIIIFYATALPCKQFLDIVYAILCNLGVFSKSSEFWKLSVRDNDPSKKTKKSINGVGKAHCMLSFISGG